jgi:hypothetical protein
MECLKKPKEAWDVIEDSRFICLRMFNFCSYFSDTQFDLHFQYEQRFRQLTMSVGRTRVGATSEICCVRDLLRHVKIGV